MFTVAQRDALRDRLLRLADADERVVAGAVVGSLAVDGGGDRFSDLDLTFGMVGGLEPGLLRQSLAACVAALVREGAEARLPHATVVAERLGLLLTAAEKKRIAALGRERP